ncbi:hypothetical protein NIES4103_62170 [Nostoc sp. NIES-4103]|nr:hypothetical protein NIES4103_62170 [Nostoc sp. NIES-4103]
MIYHPLLDEITKINPDVIYLYGKKITVYSWLKFCFFSNAIIHKLSINYNAGFTD